ncbi:MAG: phosphoribosyl-AMP cyclohydrolase, partial [Candidatus Omnitrophica bacterium]|nr:phosphoribosyl-AMP cyclohydrolase [Candidatus Omnitrophota bacterium]
MSKKTDWETIQITPRNLSKLKFNADGLVPAIIQDHKDGEVLMLA